MTVCVCVSVLVTVKSDGERHGHGLKGNSTGNYVGPKTFAELFSVGSNFLSTLCFWPHPDR